LLAEFRRQDLGNFNKSGALWAPEWRWCGSCAVLGIVPTVGIVPVALNLISPRRDETIKGPARKNQNNDTDRTKTTRNKAIRQNAGIDRVKQRDWRLP
jgi:hypothetical protein